MRTTVLILAALAASPVFAQDAARDVSPAQIAFYQAGMVSGCKDAGQRSGDSADQVEAFCGCMVQVLKTELTQDEWQQAYRYSLNHQNKEEMQLLGRHLQSVQSCRGKSL
jgi:hypothetical protein